jgi:hypothetical protein
MSDGQEDRLPPGHQPYDPLNGFRIGAVAGGILGAIVMVVTSLTSLWVMLIGAFIGGVIGFLYQKRRLREAAEP